MGGAILPKTGHVAEGEKVLETGIAQNRNTEKEWELCKETAILVAATEHQPGRALPYAEMGREQAKLARDEQTGKPDAFPVQLMTRLCRTLQRDIAGAKKS